MAQKKSQTKNSSNCAICYYRSSPRPQSEAAIERQKEAAYEWAKANGYEILREYQDVANSGTNDERPGYQGMLDEVSVLMPSVLLLWNADRLGRDPFEITAARKAMADAGCQVCYVAGGASDGGSSGLALMESMLAVMADCHSK